jgi:hypothetical protein
MSFLLDKASNEVWVAKYPARRPLCRPDAGDLGLGTLATMAPVPMASGALWRGI